MIPAKEIDGELWVKASDHHQAIKEALAYVKKLEEALATKIRHRYEDSPVALSLPITTTSHD